MTTEISASAVMELREKTGAGMMDCKKALMEAAGDAEKAVEILRQKGLKKSAEKASRVAKEGIVLARVGDAKDAGAMIELNCETDFVAKNEEFVALGRHLVEEVFTAKPADLDGFLSAHATFNNGKTVADSLAALTGKIGEKIAMKRLCVVKADGGVVASYIHPGNKLGVLIELRVENFAPAEKTDVHTLAYDLAMQVAAMNPSYIERTNVPPDVIEKEMEILREQGKHEGKPEKVLENIIKGRLEKFYQEVCLTEQIFVKDGSKSVKELVNDLCKRLNKRVVIHRFERYRLGD